MAQPNIPNLHPIQLKRNTELNMKDDDMSLLFQQTVNREDGEAESRQKSSCCSPFTDPELNVYKLFYFLFYAASALFAYLPLYYKNSLLLDHHHIGILMGIRPFCAFLSAPMLGGFADKFNKYKSILFTGLMAYIIIYLSITFVDGVPKNCGDEVVGNITSTTPVVKGAEAKANQVLEVNEKDKFSQLLADIISKRSKATELQNQGQSTSLNIKESKSQTWKSFDIPRYYSEDENYLPKIKVVFRNHEDHILTNNDKTIITEIVSNSTKEKDHYDKYWLDAPETAGEDAWPIDVYRKERPNHISKEDANTRRHIFLTLLILMLIADVIGAPILSLTDTVTLQTLKKQPYKYGHQIAWAAVGFGVMSITAGSVLHYTVSEEDEVNDCPEKTATRYKPVFYSCCSLLLLALFASCKFRFKTYEGKNARGFFFAFFKYFNNLDYILFAFLAFFTGLGTGLTESFLFVHLIHIGATPLLLVVTTAVQSISKVTFFCLTPTLILKYGYFPIIYAGMFTSVVTFFYYSFLVAPWMVVPIEILSGISHSCVWAALVSYVGAPPKIGATLQGIVHSLHIGLGRGIGGFFGGMILLHYGFSILFRSFSLCIILVLVIVCLVRYRRENDVEPIWSKLWDYSPVAPYESFYDKE